MPYPINPCGCFSIPELPLEPSDCWEEDLLEEPYEEEYDRMEDELNGRISRR